MSPRGTKAGPCWRRNADCYALYVADPRILDEQISEAAKQIDGEDTAGKIGYKHYTPVVEQL